MITYVHDKLQKKMADVNVGFNQLQGEDFINNENFAKQLFSRIRTENVFQDFEHGKYFHVIFKVVRK